MQNTTITYKKDHVHVWSNFPGITGSGTDTSVQNELTRRFFFTGFGPNVGKKFVDPVPGEYTKILRYEGYGLWGWYDRLHWSAPLFYPSSLVGWSLSEGVCSARPSYAASYVQAKPSFDPTTYNKALDRFYEEMSESETNLAQSLFELRETGRMFARIKDHTLPELLKLARKVKREWLRNPSKWGKSPSKALSSLWLQYKYAWSPLVQEIYDYAAFTGRWFDGFKFKGTAKRTEAIKDTYTGNNVGFSGQWRHVCNGQRQWKAKVQCVARVTDMGAYDRARLTTLNPLSIAWELTTLSFVVDWFYDVGGYLQNMERAMGSGLEFVRGFVTELASVTVQEHSTNVGDCFEPWVSGRLVQHKWNGRSQAARVEKRRIKLSGFPRPKAPRLEWKLGWQRIISFTALFRTILLGGVKR